MTLIAGALLGFVAVAFGAYAEHGLRATLSEEAFHSVLTAVRYNLVHAAVVAAIGMVTLSEGTRHAVSLKRIAWVFVLGTVLFSFTIYGAAVWQFPSLTRITPAGGMLLMAGWLGLAWVGLSSLSRSSKK